VGLGYLPVKVGLHICCQRADRYHGVA